MELEEQIHQINLKIVHLEQKKEAIRRRTNYALEQKDEAKIKATSKARSRFQMNGEQQQLESWKEEKKRLLSGGAHCSHSVSCDYFRKEELHIIERRVMEDTVKQIMDNNPDLTFGEAEEEASLLLFRLNNRP